MKFSREMLTLYAVTDRSWTGTTTLYKQVEAALQGGVTLVQLREKTLTDEQFISEALQIKELCHRYGVPLIINDRLDVAVKAGADGVHVGIEDTPVQNIRKSMGAEFIIGATAKTLSQARKAQEAGADYLGVGAVFPSPTKKNAIRITPEILREICTSVTIPAVAIGGIDLNNIAELKGCGISGVAAVSAIFGAEDIKSASELMYDRARAVISADRTLNK